MQNDIVRRPVVRPPARQVPAEDSSQPQAPFPAAQGAEESPAQSHVPADSAPLPSGADPATDQAPDIPTSQLAENPQPEATSQPDTNAKKHGHGLVIAFAVVVFIGLAFAAVYLEISSQKTQVQPALPETQQSTNSPESVNSSIGLQP